MNGRPAKTDQPLSDRQVDVWFVRSDGIDDPRLFDEYRSRLPTEEVQRAGRFVFEQSRLEYLIARMLVRTVLSHYTGMDVKAWRFVPNAYGKPAVAAPAGVRIEFNLSHAAGLVVCAVTGGRDVGIDVESADRKTDHLTLARRFFAPAEAAAIEQAPPEKQADLFLRFWTLKEAFIKARGMGLSIPLADVAFTLDDRRPPAVSFQGSVDEAPDQWQFVELPLAASHRVALAVRLPAVQPAVIRVRQTVPLRWQTDAQVLTADSAGEWSD